MTTGEKIKIFRTNKKWTQKKLAEKSGIHEVQIRRYESGSIVPKMNNLTKIANALGVSYTELTNKDELLVDPPESDFIKSLKIPPKDKKVASSITRKLKEIGYTVVKESFSTNEGYTLTFSNANSNTISLDARKMKELNTETDDFLKFKIESYKNKEK